MDGAETLSFSQQNRLLAIETPLGPDKLVLIGLSGRDEISDTFVLHATMFSTDHTITANSIIGKNVTIWISFEDVDPRPLNGIVRRFSAGGVSARGVREYQAEIVPWFWFLTCTADCRVFQNLTFPEIAQKLFAEYRFEDFELRLTGTYPKLDYCVQYRESAFTFLSRWMEKLGISYFFRHEATRHVMVLADHNLAFKDVGEKDAYFLSGSSGNISEWQHVEEFRSGRYVQGDFAFKTPSLDLVTQERGMLNQTMADSFEIFDFPGGYTEVARGRALTRTRIEEQEACYHIVEGSGVCASFTAGGKFTIARHSVKSEEGKSFLLTRVVHEGRDESHYSTSADAPSYNNSFVAVPIERPFRPQTCTPWPVIQGPQTAIVVGQSGENIYTEKHGRVKLQFHWDRRGKRDENSSCWVRVSQNSAGAGWGGVFIPHIGHEVIVSFIDGDPDRPVVTGRVYNGENAQSISLPANKTQSAIRDHAGNEILLEGKSGVQDIRVTATKDMHINVQHDRAKTVLNNEMTRIGANRVEMVGVAETVTVGAVRSVAIGADDSLTVGALRTVTVGGDQAVAIGGNHSVSVGGNSGHSVDKGYQMDAGDRIVFKTGSASIKMSSDGDIVIEGKAITIKASGDLVMKASKISEN